MLTRRDFMTELAVAGAAIAAMPANVFAAVPRVRTAVVSIYMDQPYIDATGRELPYFPPDARAPGCPWRI